MGIEMLYSHGPLALSTRVRCVQRIVGAYGNASYPVNDLFIDGHTIIDASGSWHLSSSFELFANIENLLDRRYVVNNDSYSPPQLGTPFSAFAGARVHP